MAQLPLKDKREAEPYRHRGGDGAPRGNPAPLTPKEIRALVAGEESFPKERIITSMNSTYYPPGNVNREMMEAWLRFQTYEVLVEIRDLAKAEKKA